MRFTEEKLEAIDDGKFKKLKSMGYSSGMGVTIDNVANRAEVCLCNHVICGFTELQELIDNLTCLRDAIEKETGIIIH